jgi:hypothetical protein
MLFPGYTRCKKKPDSQPSLAKRNYESGFALKITILIRQEHYSYSEKKKQKR